jgi:hypothetical protein
MHALDYHLLSALPTCYLLKDVSLVDNTVCGQQHHAFLGDLHVFDLHYLNAGNAHRPASEQKECERFWSTSSAWIAALCS